MPLNAITAISIVEKLLRARKLSLELLYDPTQTVDLPATLVNMVVDLTEFRNALQFFGPTLLSIEVDDVDGGDSQKAILAPLTMVSLTAKCYSHFENRERDQDGCFPGLSVEDSRAVLDCVQPRNEDLRVPISTFLNGFLAAIGSGCLTEIKAWFKATSITREEAPIPLLRKVSRSAFCAHARPGDSSPRPTMGSGTSPSLLTVPSPIADNSLAGNVIYSTSPLASSSASLALKSLGRSPDEPIDETSEYGRQVVQSATSHLDLNLSNNQTDQDPYNNSLANEDLLGDASSTTALSLPSLARVTSPDSSLSAKILSGISSGGKRVLRQMTKSPASSSKGLKSRDASVTRLEPARPTPPLPTIMTSPKPVIVASVSPMIVTPDGKSFYNPDGTGLRDEKGEPLVGLLVGLDKLSKANLLSDNFWKNALGHCGKCHFEIHGDPEAIISNRTGPVSHPIQNDPNHIDFTYRRTGGATGIFVFSIICSDLRHRNSNLECTKAPFSFRYPVDLGAVLEALEAHSADRTVQMARATMGQVLLAAEAEVAESRLRAAVAAGEAGGLGEV